MTNAQHIADRYIAVWNERDPARRRSLLTDGWTEDARYVDPLMQGQGREQIGALIAAVHERFADFRFALIGQADGHGDQLRFSWGLGPEGAESPIKGTDFVVVDGGRVASVTGFLDQVPAAA